MKCVLEFGVRGERHVDNQVIPNVKLGKELFKRLCFVFGREEDGQEHFLLKDFGKNVPRISWSSSSHFVSLSVMDGEPRGSASFKLWRKKDEK